jgi:hypothetical protein
MKKVILSAVMAMMMVGCGSGDSSDTKEVIIPNDSVITLDENQTIGYKPNTDVNTQIYNLGDGSYYVTCGDSENCNLHIGDINEDNDVNYSDINNTTDSNNPTDSNDDNSPIAVIETPVIVENTTNNYTAP